MEDKDPIYPYYRDSRGIRHPLKKRKPLKRTPLKRKKPLKKKVKKVVKPKEKVQYRTITYKQQHILQTHKEFFRNEWALFDAVWQKREHYCENCGIGLPEPAKAIYFSHVLPKSLYNNLRLKEENIDLLCEDCHGLWHFGNKKAMKIYSEDRIRELRELSKLIGKG